MRELYLVAYTYECNILTHEREFKSISYGPEFKDFRRLIDIAHDVEKKSGDRCVHIMAVTELHKIIDYAGENQTNRVGVIPA